MFKTQKNIKRMVGCISIPKRDKPFEDGETPTCKSTNEDRYQVYCDKAEWLNATGERTGWLTLVHVTRFAPLTINGLTTQ